MLTWFTEDSLMPLILGTVLALSFLGLAISHYSRAMFGLALLVGLLTATVVGIESWVVTDREEIQAMVRRLATAIEAHDVDEVVGAISVKPDSIRDQARDEMQKYRVDSCRLLDFTDFKIDDLETPKKSEITFVVLARGMDQYGNRGTAHERVTLFFEKDESGNWKIYDYKHEYARARERL